MQYIGMGYLKQVSEINQNIRTVDAACSVVHTNVTKMLKAILFALLFLCHFEALFARAVPGNHPLGRWSAEYDAYDPAQKMKTLSAVPRGGNKISPKLLSSQC
jgi:hypothetical protein